MVRVAKRVQEIQQGSVFSGNFGWRLAKMPYSTEELLQCTHRGVGKQTITPLDNQ